MKSGARVIAVDDSPLRGKRILCTGVVARLAASSWFGVEGIISFKVARDGSDSAEKLVGAVKKSKFFKQIRAIIVHSVTLAGLNVLDTKKVWTELGVPVICVTKKKPEENEIQRALSNKGWLKKKRLVEEAGPVHRAAGVFFHSVGATPEEAGLVLKRLGGYPWPLRLAHLIGAAVVLGESAGG